MNILRHRPLFFCCAVFMLSAVLGFCMGAVEKWICGGLVLAAAVLCAGFLFARRRDARRAILSLVAAMLACLALVQSQATFHSASSVYVESIAHTEAQIHATVTDRRGSGGYMTSYTLLIHSVNGREVEGLAVLTCHYVSDLRPGNEVEMTATILPLSEVANPGYDVSMLVGDGYVLGLLSEDEKAVTVIREDSRLLRVRAGNLRRSLSARLQLIVGDEAGGLPSALLLGDKSYLSDAVRRDFSRAGVSHLLAISGLHMTLLFGILALLLIFLRVPKRVRAAVLSAGAVGYLILLGFPPSATRAVIMLGITYLSHILSEQADPLTSLGVAGGLILALSPCTVCDAGFWMSFLAVLGLVTCVPAINERLEKLRHGREFALWKQIILEKGIKLAVTLAVGVIAMSFTLFVVASSIGEMGVLSPLSTLLLTPLCAVVLVLSLLILPMMGTAAAAFLGRGVEIACAALTNLAARMAEPSGVVISLRHPAVRLIAAIMMATTLILLVVRLPKRRQWIVVLPLLAGWVAVGLVLTTHSYLTRNNVKASYLQPSTVSDALVMVAGNEGFVCDLSNGSLTALSAATREARLQGATELSAFMLTHYHTRTSGALEIILEQETVRSLWMPTPTNEDEYDLMLACLEKAEASGVPVCLYGNGEKLRVFGSGSLSVEKVHISRSVQPVILVSMDISAEDVGDDRLLYCGSAVFESSLADKAAELVSRADIVIFGNHGPLVKKVYGGELDLSGADCVIVSAYGEVAPWFEAEPHGEIPLWMGQKRWILKK